MLVLKNGRSKFHGRVADFIKCPYVVIKMMMQNPCERQGKWRSIKIHCKYQYNLCLPQQPKSWWSPFFALFTAVTSSTKVSGSIAMDLLIHLTLFAYVRQELEERVPSQAPCSSSARTADCGARSCHAQWLTRDPSVPTPQPTCCKKKRHSVASRAC